MIELMLASALGSMVLASITSTTFFNARSSAALSNYVDLDVASRNALDTMTQEIRQANRLLTGSTNELVFEDFDGIPLTYTYSPQLRQLTRIKGTSVRVLLDNCDVLAFSLFQRNPVQGTYDQYPAATAATCKLVQMTWVCSRKIFGTTANTESVQSAKVVIRRQ